MQALAQSAEDTALGVQGVTKSNGASANASRRLVAMAASNGFARALERTSFGPQRLGGGRRRPAMERDYDAMVPPHFEDLEAPEKIGRTAESAQ